MVKKYCITSQNYLEAIIWGKKKICGPNCTVKWFALTFTKNQEVVEPPHNELTKHLIIFNMPINEPQESDNGEWMRIPDCLWVFFIKIIIIYTSGIERPGHFFPPVVQVHPRKHTSTMSPWLQRGQDQQSHFTVYWCTPIPWCTAELGEVNKNILP